APVARSALPPAAAGGFARPGGRTGSLRSPSWPRPRTYAFACSPSSRVLIIFVTGPRIVAGASKPRLPWLRLDGGVSDDRFPQKGRSPAVSRNSGSRLRRGGRADGLFGRMAGRPFTGQYRQSAPRRVRGAAAEPRSHQARGDLGRIDPVPA